MTTPTFVRAYPAAGTLGNGPGNNSMSVNIDTTGLGASGALVVFIDAGASGANMTGKSFTTPTLGGSSTGWTETIAETLNAASVSGMKGAWVLLNPSSSASIALALGWTPSAGASDEIMIVVGLYSDVSSVSAFTVDNDGGSSTSDTMTNAAGAGNLTVGSWSHGSAISSVTSGTLRGVINNYSTNFSNGCTAFIEGGTAAFSSGSSDSNIGMQIKLLGTAGAAAEDGFDQRRQRAPGQFGPGAWVASGDHSDTPSTAVTNAPAESATGTGTAFNAKATVAPTAGNAAGTGAALNAKATVAPTAGAATGTGTAFNASETVAPTAGNAAGTGTSFTAKATVAPVAGLASGTGTAYDATAQTGSNTNAPAECATGTGTAYNASVTIATSAGAATGTGTAFTAKVTIAPTAGAANGTGTAYNPGKTVAPVVGLASGTGTAYNATATTSGNTNAPAGLASGTGTAFNAKVTIAVLAGVAAGTGSAYTAATGAEAGIGATFLASRRPTSELVAVGTSTGVLRPTVSSAVASPLPATLLQPTRTNTEYVDE